MAYAFVIGACVLMVAPPARAQDAREYAGRVNRLNTAFKLATERVKAFDDSIRRVRLTDTVRFRSITVASDRELLPMARGAAARAYQTMFAVYGDATDSLSRHVFSMRLYRDTTEDPRVIVARMLGESPALDQDVARNEEAVAASLHSLGERTLAEGMERSYRDWSPGGMNRDSVPDDMWASERLNLVSSGAAVSRRCYAGDLHGCAISLRLEPITDPVTDWYDAADRRRLVHSSGMNARRADHAATRRCLAGADQDCIDVLHQLSRNDLPAPLRKEDRAIIVRLALQMGGPDAARRLLVTPGGPRERLSAAAGVPLDSVISRWQRRTRDTRKASDQMSPAIAAASLSWILVLGALSLRSARWR